MEESIRVLKPQYRQPISEALLAGDFDVSDLILRSDEFSRNGAPVPRIEPIRNILTKSVEMFAGRSKSMGEWDAWAAPRLHHVLRLTR